MSLEPYITGQVVVPYCNAFFKVLNPDCVETRCNNCFLKKPELEICQGCTRVRYCDNDCKLEDWERGHKLECISIGLPPCIAMWASEIKIMIFRLYALLKLNPGLIDVQYRMYDDTTRCFNNLTSNEILWARHVPIVNICQDMVEYLNAEHPDIKFEYLIRLYGIFQLNSLPIFEDDKVIGNGIYIEASCFDHSCKPTANCLMTNTKLEIRTMTMIDKGVVPSISYCDLGKHYTTLTRRNILYDKYQFQCQCAKCIEEINHPVNYERVQLLNSRMNSLFNGEPAGDVLQWNDIKPLHNELLDYLRQIFNEYDMHITKYFMSFFYLSIKKNADETFITHMRSQALGHIAVSVGIESELFKKFPFGV